MPETVINGVRTHFQRVAAKTTGPKAPTIVFVHGLGTDSLASFYLTLAGPLSVAGLETIAYDLRAHGRTASPATGYRVADFVSDLEALLEELGVEEPVHLVGNSFGGTIAFSYAALRPHRVASIVAIEAEPATRSWAEKMARTLSNVTAELSQEETFAWITDNFGAHHARLARAARKRLLTTSIGTEVPRGPLLGPEQIRAIRCPVLAVLGEEGFQKDDLRALEVALPRCRTEILPGQDHSVLVEAHRTIRSLVLDWVFRASRPDSAGAA